MSISSFITDKDFPAVVAITTRGLLRTGRRIDLEKLERKLRLTMNDNLAVMRKEVACEEECL